MRSTVLLTAIAVTSACDGVRTVAPPPPVVDQTNERAHELLHCLAAEAATRSSLDGRIVTDLDVDGEGRVIGARLAESTVPNDGAIRECIRNEVVHWRFPHLGRAVVRVSAPWETPHGDCPAADGRGCLTKQMIRLVIRSHLLEVKQCYERGLASSPTFEGKLVTRFTVGGEGRVIAVEALESSGRPDVDECITHAQTGWLFPRPSNGGSVVVTYPFVLRTSKQPARQRR